MNPPNTLQAKGSYDMTHATTNDEAARLTADVIALADHDGQRHVLLIERRWPPHEGHLALPGGHVDVGEDIEAAGARELTEETGLTATRLDFVGVFSAPGRDPRGRYVTFAFVALLDTMVDPVAGDDARTACWVPLATVLDDPGRLAFDHYRIIADALDHLNDQADQVAS